MEKFIYKDSVEFLFNSEKIEDPHPKELLLYLFDFINMKYSPREVLVENLNKICEIGIEYCEYLRGSDYLLRKIKVSKLMLSAIVKRLNNCLKTINKQDLNHDKILMLYYNYILLLEGYKIK